MSERVLIVDDEANMRWVLGEALTTAGYDVAGAGNGQEALQQMSKGAIDLVILDLKLKGMDGLATLRHLRERWPEVVVIILTAYGTVTTAVEAMQLGAADYLRKPFDVEEVVFKLQRALERKRLQAEVQQLRQRVFRGEQHALIGGDPGWLRCVEQVRSLTALGLDLLLIGETGTGKTLLGRLAHTTSERRERPLVELDLRTIPASLQQLIIQGHTSNEGAWSKAGAGTLLLMHAELLATDGWATLHDLYVQRNAGRGPRLILTTTTPVQTDGMLLPEVHVPSLRERPADIPLLARAFLEQVALRPPALDMLTRYGWPGNVAELRSVLAQAAAASNGSPIDEQHLPVHIRQSPRVAAPISLPAQGLSLETVERSLLQQALELAGGNKTRAAELLGLTRHTLLYRLEKYGLGT